MNCSMKVVDIYRIQPRRDGILEDASIYILTFDTCQLPDKIILLCLLIGWTAYSVKEYVPRQRSCYKCLRFGQCTKTCRTQDGICYNCSEITHDLPSTRPTKCPNCDQPHSANYNKCFYFRLEQEILTTQVKENISYADTKKKVNNKYAKPDQSYSAAVCNQKQAYAGNTQSHPCTMTASVRGARDRGTVT